MKNKDSNTDEFIKINVSEAQGRLGMILGGHILIMHSSDHTFIAKRIDL